MIFGNCPHCDEPITNRMPAKSPAVFKNTCNNCHKEYWIYATRLGECMAYDEEAFNKEFIVDEENNTFKRRSEDG